MRAQPSKLFQNSSPLQAWDEFEAPFLYSSTVMTTDTDIIALIMTTSTQYYAIRARNHVRVTFSIEKGLDPWSMYLNGTQQLNKTSCLIYLSETGTGLDTLQAPDWKFDDNTYDITCTQNKNLFNTFTAIVDLSRFNNSCLKSPVSTLVDKTFQSRALRSFSLNQLRNLSL